MSDLEAKKLEMRKKKAEAAIAELEYKIAERQEDIKRIQDHIALQKQQLVEVGLELDKLNGGQNG